MIKNHEEAIAYLKNSTFSERNLEFREAINKIDYNLIRSDEVGFLESLYFKLKDVALRNKILICLSKTDNKQLEQFFRKAYKKERYLDMRLIAVRALAKYVPETEIEKNMEHFLKILIKRPENTPYNYQEYEYLRSPSGLPYLVEKYEYLSFQKALQQVTKQYEDMPSAFKGHYTFDNDDNLIQLRTPEEVSKMIQEFFASNKYSK